MKRLLKPLLVLVLILITQQIIFAQDVEKTVEIVVSGSAKTKDEAKQLALRSAIEQAFGVFISSKTEILNDNLVSDQITSIASGNIKSYQVLIESQLPDGSWGVTLKSIVSIDKLTSFVQAKGVEVEVKGGLFALNIKQQLLNEQAEIKAVNDLIGLLHEPMQISFDYEIKIGQPKLIEDSKEDWGLQNEVSVVANKNIDLCANYFVNTLEALSLTSNEIENYKILNKEIFPINVNYKGRVKTIYLRNLNSVNSLNFFSSTWKFYTRLFKVVSNLESYNGLSLRNKSIENIFYKHSIPYKGSENRNTIVNFLDSGQFIATYKWTDTMSLSKIELLTSYKVEPSGVVSYFKQGGYVFFEDNSHGLVFNLIHSDQIDWYEAKSKCANLSINGFSDWRLPTLKELEILYDMGLYGNTYDFYWSNSQINNEEVWTCGFMSFSKPFAYTKVEKNMFYVIPVREFIK